MRSHWREVHGFSESFPNSSSFARPVKLQTFFRGTKLRYFEVTSPQGAIATKMAREIAIGDEEVHDGGRDEEEPEVQGHDLAASTLLPLPTPPPFVPTFPNAASTILPLPTPLAFVPTSPHAAPEPSPVNRDLETLTYFHHFTTNTSLTLPSAEHPWPGTHYWQTDTVLQALRRSWLMSGLLAISACHLAVLTDDRTVERAHCERSARFFAEFSTGWEELMKPSLDVGVVEEEQEARRVGGQVRCLLRCAYWAFNDSVLYQGVPLKLVPLFELESFMTTIRDFVVPDFSLRSDGVQNHDDGHQEDPFSQTIDFLGTGSSSANPPTAIFNRLQSLPSLLTETIGKPDNIHDVFATLSAIATLTSCCATSFASDEAGAAWQGMTMWVTKVPEHFSLMVLRSSPAALVVLAHWAAFLVQRAEESGSWFLRGLAERVLRMVAERLSEDDRAVKGLVGLSY
jgi:hypothetical protein